VLITTPLSPNDSDASAIIVVSRTSSYQSHLTLHAKAGSHQMTLTTHAAPSR
jgi:hypothetical protein